MRQALASAWDWRESRGVFSGLEALRVFYGPGEADPKSVLARVAIDRFGDHYWVTEWESKARSEARLSSRDLAEIARFLESKGARSVVALLRPEKGIPSEPKNVFGAPPEGRFEIREEEARFLIQLQGARHPGLFLDHLPLRRWLRARMGGLRVLNTFAYTGSLSVACALGGASHVTTLDLSNPTIRWARENWRANGLEESRARFVSGDYFEWLPRLKREKGSFDCVILDPPSFSRGTKGSFSTSKDLRRLHGLAFEVLEKGGILVTSINSANVPIEKYQAEVSAAAREKGRELTVLAQIDLPETFPTRLAASAERYLKGWVLKA